MGSNLEQLGQLAAGFREEAAERIAELEGALLELERDPGNGELVDRAFRALHTVKGSGAMFGLDALAAFTHEVETVFDAVRAGRVPVTAQLVALGLEAKDRIRALLDGEPEADGARERVLAALRALTPGAIPAAAPVSPAEPAAAAGAAVGQERTYRLRFKPQPGILQDGTNLLGLLTELRGMGPCTLAARTDAVPPLEELSPEACHLWWEGTLTTDRGAEAIRDVFIFVEDRCELSIEALPPAAGSAVSAEPVAPAPRPALAPGGAAPPAGAPRARSVRSEAASSVRVAAEKLDRLVDLVGELVIAQARLSRLAAAREDPELLAVSEEVERLSTELRDSTLEVRMVPIGTTFARFRRLVHDLSGELGKEIELVTEGAETELDKTVIERIGDPLVHLIRNSCDHGIEAPQAREASGKPARGTVRLSAYHSGPSVFVEIRDDGAGMDPARIRAKAVERGLLAPEARASDKELFSLVFLPGFSTAAQVSNVSGRGVGMDVVKRSIEALRGTVAIESAPGAGTTVRIQLPLTLAIIEGLLVSVGDGTYVLPLSAVEECVELTREDVEAAHGARVATVRGELVPYLRLRELFEVQGRPEREQIAIVRHGEGRCGFVVDGVIGQHQIVIKSLGRMARGAKGLSGATILGDGTVALIVDVGVLAGGAMREG